MLTTEVMQRARLSAISAFYLGSYVRSPLEETVVTAAEAGLAAPAAQVAKAGTASAVLLNAPE
jgi:hypothetical protein